MNCFAIAISWCSMVCRWKICREICVHLKFEPSGMVDHPISRPPCWLTLFRALAFEYLGRTDLVHVLDKPTIGNTGGGGGRSYFLGKPELSSVRYGFFSSATTAAQPQKLQRPGACQGRIGMDQECCRQSMQSDAPACNTAATSPSAAVPVTSV